MKINRFFLLATFMCFVPIKNVLAQTAIQEVTSPQGVTAWLVTDTTIPIVALEASFKGGLSREPENKEGVATLFAGLLDEGAGDLDAQAFTRKSNALGSYFSFDAGMDSFSVSARFLKKNMAPSVTHLQLALQKPRFDQAAIDRVKGQIISSINQRAVNPSAQAGIVFGKKMLPDTRYGRSDLGTLESVDNLTRDDLTAIMPVILNRQNLTVSVVGDITAEELAPVLDTLFADLPNTPVENLADVIPAVNAGTVLTQMDIPQSVVQFGHTGIMRDNPDYIPLSIVNYVLGGGGFASRLIEEIREKNGLVYSVSTYLLPYHRTGLYLGSFATANETVEQAIDLVKEEWAKMAKHGMTQKELDNAKIYLTGAFPLRFDSNAKIARYISSVQEYDLGIDYINQYTDLINAVTLDEVNAAAKKYLKPENLLFSVVGDQQTTAVTVPAAASSE